MGKFKRYTNLNPPEGQTLDEWEALIRVTSHEFAASKSKLERQRRIRRRNVCAEMLIKEAFAESFGASGAHKLPEAHQNRLKEIILLKRGIKQPGKARSEEEMMAIGASADQADNKRLSPAQPDFLPPAE